jgi:hypothetical protein
MSVGILLLTGLGARTDLPLLWAWMFLAGLGVGPTLSVFTIVIQASVPFSRLGVATGNLVFFRQVGASVGLAIVGTVFAESFVERLQPALLAAGVPAQQAAVVAGMSASGGDLTQVGTASLPDRLAQVPPLAGIVDQVVAGVYEAFSHAIGDTFWFGLAATLLALLVVAVGLRDVPLLGRGPAVDVDESVEPDPAPMTFA